MSVFKNSTNNKWFITSTNQRMIAKNEISTQIDKTCNGGIFFSPNDAIDGLAVIYDNYVYGDYEYGIACSHTHNTDTGNSLTG